MEVRTQYRLCFYFYLSVNYGILYFKINDCISKGRKKTQIQMNNILQYSVEQPHLPESLISI